MSDTCPVCGKGEWEKDTVSRVPHLDCVLRLNATLKLRDEALFHAEADASREHDCVEHWSLRAEQAEAERDTWYQRYDVQKSAHEASEKAAQQAEAERDELEKMLRRLWTDYGRFHAYDDWLADLRRRVRDGA